MKLQFKCQESTKLTLYGVIICITTIQIMAVKDDTRAFFCNKTVLYMTIPNINTTWVAEKIKFVIKQLFQITVMICNDSQKVNDVVLNLVKMSPTAGKIKYEKGVSENIHISAATPKMILHTAIHALIKAFLLKLSPGETEIDYQQQERILLLDIGRKHYSKDAILNIIDVMFLAQFNYLQLHISENFGFRIESTMAPYIVSREHLTKNEIKEIQEYARKHGIEIIPDIDSPCHLQQVLNYHRDWCLLIQNRQNLEYVFQVIECLNICDPSAVDFILSIYEEFAELFSGSTYFHIGGDEFANSQPHVSYYPELEANSIVKFGLSAKPVDLFIDYINTVSKIIHSWGFIPRVWNDGFFRLDRKQTVNLFDKLEITYWTQYNQNFAPVKTFVDKGYRVLNFNDQFLYYVLGERFNYIYPTYNSIIANWTPSLFSYQEIENLTDQFPGVGLSIWSDDPEAKSEFEVWKDSTFLLFAIMQKMTKEVFMNKTDVKNIVNTYLKSTHATEQHD